MPPQPDRFYCLNPWPKGTVSHEQERRLIQALWELCDEHGLIRVEQLMAAIGDIWRHPEKEAEYAKFYIDEASEAIGHQNGQSPSGSVGRRAID